MPPKKSNNRNNHKKGEGSGGGMTKKEYEAKRKREMAEAAKDKANRREDSQEKHSKFYHEATTAGLPAGRRFVGLHHSITQGQGPIPKGQSIQRRFYPGAPKWMDIPNFFEVVAHEWRPVAGAPSEARFTEEVKYAKQTRRYVRMMDSAYREAGGHDKKLTVREHKNIFHKCAAVLQWDAPDDDEWSHKELFSDEQARDTLGFKIDYAEHEPTQKVTTPVCQRCKDLLLESDPPECVCGEFYCSDSCHEADWANHEKHCQKEPHMALQLTQFYWQRVFVGAFPCKDEPDFVAQWRAKGINDVKEEMLFYFHNDRASCVEHLRRFLLGLDELAKRAPGAEQSFVRQMDKVCCLKMHYITPLYDDSPTRLQFKLKMSEDFYELAKQFPPRSGMDFALPNRATLIREFEALIKERKKWVNGLFPVPVPAPRPVPTPTATTTSPSTTPAAGNNSDKGLPPCAHCGKIEASERCSKCKVGYCNSECQTADWKVHKKKCKDIAQSVEQ